jgi:hypothetical protein
MTTFQDLQAEHEALLNRHEAPADPAQFWADVQHFIDHIRIEAQYISAPRERDQLRAILRFWSSYVFDKTGTYPDTTLRPAMNADSSKAASTGSSVPPTKPPTPTPPPPPHRTSAIWGIAALAVVAVVVAVIALRASGGTAVMPSGSFVPIKTPDASVNVVATAESPSAPTLEIQWSILTTGPSPFDPNVWATRLQLSATGGNGSYIFWVNGVRLPDVSDNQFTVEGTGCESKKPVVGVTSGGQATSLELIIQSPLNCPQP